jgi:hypothetical protein
MPLTDRSMRRLTSTSLRLVCAALALSALGGCGVLALPCRVASAALKAVPVVGHVAAVPTDVCAKVIDP